MRALKYLLTLAVTSFPVLLPSAHAATLCVDQNGAYPCFQSIGDAVAAAAPGDLIRVGPGTYFETVVITQPVSLITDNAVVDASGRSRGFFIDGIGPTALANVNLSGFTVRNANFEGVLAVNASAVTLSNLTVINNDRVSTGTRCPGLDDFEATGTSDCGQGIHLLGVDHSVVTNSFVQGNTGGILISDDTGAAHDNVISFNTVINNPNGSGISMTSNATALQVQGIRAFRAAAEGNDYTLPSSYGVYHNTVYGNRSRGNGQQGGGGGVQISATVPGAAAYSNVVVANYLAENANPGVILHATQEGQNLSDNLILGNSVLTNGADTGLAVTPGTTGINVFSTETSTGTMVIGNAVQGENFDVAVQVPSSVQVQLNTLQGYGVGVANLGYGNVNAAENFWGCPNGPSLPQSCATVQGPNVQWPAWLTMQLPVQPSF